MQVINNTTSAMPASTTTAAAHIVISESFLAKTFAALQQKIISLVIKNEKSTEKQEEKQDNKAINNKEETRKLFNDFMNEWNHAKRMKENIVRNY